MENGRVENGRVEEKKEKEEVKRQRWMIESLPASR